MSLLHCATSPRVVVSSQMTFCFNCTRPDVCREVDICLCHYNYSEDDWVLMHFLWCWALTGSLSKWLPVRTGRSYCHYAICKKKKMSPITRWTVKWMKLFSVISWPEGQTELIVLARKWGWPDGGGGGQHKGPPNAQFKWSLVYEWKRRSAWLDTDPAVRQIGCVRESWPDGRGLFKPCWAGARPNQSTLVVHAQPQQDSSKHRKQCQGT